MCAMLGHARSLCDLRVCNNPVDNPGAHNYCVFNAGVCNNTVSGTGACNNPMHNTGADTHVEPKAPAGCSTDI